MSILDEVTRRATAKRLAEEAARVAKGNAPGDTDPGPPNMPEETPKLMEDPFLAFWEDHRVNRSGLPPEVVEEFRQFAAEIWNAARFEIAARHADLLLCITREVPGETRHETARRYLSEGDGKTREALERHSKLSGK